MGEEREAGLSARNFKLVLAGQAVSLMGGAVQRVCIALYLLELTGSAGVYSAVLAASALPYVLCAPMAGAVADAFNRRDVMVMLDAACALIMGCFAATLFAGVHSVPLAAAVMVLLAVAATFYSPAVSACIPQIVPAEKLARANGAVSAVGSWCNMLGPVLAGVLYAAAGIEWACFLYAACLAASALFETRIQIRGVPGASHSVRDVLAVGPTLRSMRGTLGELRRSYPVVLGVIVSYGLVNVFVLPINTVLLPSALMLDMGVTSQVYGLVEGLAAFGMVAGAALVAVLPGRFAFERCPRWYAFLPLVLAAMGAAFAWRTAIGPAAVLCSLAVGAMVVMLCLGITNVVTLTYNQTHVPVSMLGSLSALSTAFASSTVPVGQLAFGAALEADIGCATLLFVASLASLAVCAFVRWNVQRRCD